MSESVVQSLIDMSRYLGDPQRQYAILGEGNTSARLDEDTFYVKASGTCLGTIDESGFVKVSMSRVLSILDDPAAGDDDVTRVLKEALVDPNEARRPSVETMFHAMVLKTYPEIKFIGHTHPVFTNMLLCSKHAEEAATGRVCPDQIVLMGHKSVYVPYTDPGLVLARTIRDRISQFVKEEGVVPRCIMMEGHGFIAMAESSRAVLNITDMAEKNAHIIVGAYTLGGPRFMSAHEVARIYTRPDEKYREKGLAK